MLKLLAELKQRQMFRVAAAYAVVAWLLLQLFNNVAPILELPPWVGRVVLLLIVIGFPVTLLVVWMQQLAPADGDARRAAIAKLDYVLIGALIVVIALVSYQQLAPSSGVTATQTQQPNIGPGASNAAGISIAVLPFANMSGDTSQEFFSDGMTEEITAALAKVTSLTVLGRTSAFQFKGQNRDLRDIGQALGATHLIEGSVRKAGPRVRITAQLIRADSGANLWTENYDRELTDVFAIQEDIAQAIIAALRVPLGLEQGQTLVAGRTTDLEFYDQYLRARAFYRARGTGNDEAVRILENLTARDPSYAPAWALLANAYTRDTRPGSETDQTDLTSLSEARQAVQASFAKELSPPHAGLSRRIAGMPAGTLRWVGFRTHVAGGRKLKVCIARRWHWIRATLWPWRITALRSSLLAASEIRWKSGRDCKPWSRWNLRSREILRLYRCSPGALEKAYLYSRACRWSCEGPRLLGCMLRSDVLQTLQTRSIL